MASLTDQDIEQIAQKIVTSIGGGGSAGAKASGGSAPSNPQLGIFDSVDEAVSAAKEAFPRYVKLPLKTRNRIICGIRKTMMENATALAKSAHQETGLGRFEDKIVKNQLVTEHTNGTEVLNPRSITGDHGLMLEEPAPYGVIGAITPSTNPTSTIICNAIGMVAAGNTVAFNVHPGAKNCSIQTICLLNKTIMEHGGPPNVVTCVSNPTIESAQDLMHHPDVRMLVVTGGGAVVKAAMASGKKCICGGPGNPPVVVDETADIEKAARDIVLGASTDNNIICADEKEVFVVDSVADQLIKAMTHNDAVLVDRHRLSQLEQVIFSEMHGPGKRAHINRDLIGKNADVILAQIGMNVPSTVRLAIVEVEEDHPLVITEQLMPVLPIVRVPDVDYAIKAAVKAEGGCFHTAVMHSKNLTKLHEMACACNCTIFVKNGRSQAGLGLGGEGCTSFTIASPTGEGMTGPREFSRWRRCVLVDHFRIV
jgi:acyl-CoA reductase-like NAD-dependent aldehyde dehydrogenase